MQTERQRERAKHLATLVMVAAATASVELALVESGAAVAMLHVCAALAATLGLRWAFGQWVRRLATDRRRTQLATAIVLGAALAPWAWQFALTLITSRGLNPTELTTLATARNIFLALAATHGLQRHDHMLAITCVCAVACAAVVGAHDGIGLAVALFCVSLGGWLVVRYWSALPSPARGSSLPAPWMTMAGVALIVVAIVSWRGVTGTGTGMNPIAELLHASGGELAGSDKARSGVGQGPDAAGASENATGSGHTEEDVFAKSHLPTMFDLMSKLYGSEIPPEDFERAVSVLPHQAIVARRDLDESATPNSRFSMLRRRSSETSRGGNQDADALLFVKGVSPRHLRMLTYDRFDGVRWHASPEPRELPALVRFDASLGTWMGIPSPMLVNIFHESERRFEIQFGRIETKNLPMPNHLISFHVSHVEEAQMFRCEADGRVAMVRTMPESHVVKVLTRLCDRDRLTADPWPVREGGAGQIHVSPQARAVARQWAGPEPFGWEQIEHVVQRVREHGEHQHDGPLPKITHDPVGQFITDGGAAPDYLFASTAATILHDLGYETRLVTGLYVQPDRYDWFRDHTPVLAQDVHTWCEVRRADGVWITLEPTPGYSVASIGDGQFRRVRAIFGALFGWLVEIWPMMIAALLIGSLAWCFRRGIADLAASAIWRVRATALPADQLVIATVNLIEYRSKLARRPRPPAQTWTDWVDDMQACPSIERLIVEANRSAFSKARHDTNRTDLMQLCLQVARQWTRRRLRGQTEKGPAT